MGAEESQPVNAAAAAPPKVDAATKQQYFNTDHTIHLSDDIYALREELVKTRRYFHKNPELSFKEFKTSQAIAQYLRNFDFQVTENVGQTGVVALIEGGHPGPCIMFRADMDALPVLEKVDSDFKSKVDGVMHACGHDAHMSILLGVARVMKRFQPYLHGSIKMVFQPAEEIGSGARAMIADGVLENPHVDEIYGLHVWSFIPFGTFTIKSGPLMAGQQTFDINVKGKGGHAAVPHQANDPIVTACHLVTQLQTIVSRNIDPIQSAVVTIGQIQGGTKSNVISDNVHMAGTSRFFSEETRQLVNQRTQALCDGVAQSFDTEIQFELRDETTKPVLNDVECATKILKATQLVMPTADINQTPTMGAEDMGDFLAERPGCFFFVGCGVENKENEIYPHHKDVFQIDERCLAVACQIFCTLAIELLIPTPTQNAGAGSQTEQSDPVVEEPTDEPATVEEPSEPPPSANGPYIEEETA